MRSQSALPYLWTALGQRLAVLFGALATFLSLAWEAKVHVACFRGGMAWLALLLCTRAGRWVIEKTLPDSNPQETTTFQVGP